MGEQGGFATFTQRAMKAKYLEIYFSESHIIYFKNDFKTDAIIKRAAPDFIMFFLKIFNRNGRTPLRMTQFSSITIQIISKA